jgi:hypothetical protein
MNLEINKFYNVLTIDVFNVNEDVAKLHFKKSESLLTLDNDLELICVSCLQKIKGNEAESHLIRCLTIKNKLLERFNPNLYFNNESFNNNLQNSIEKNYNTDKNSK